MSILTQKDSDELKDFIEKHKFFLIIGHKEPDGDCIASCLGLSAIIDHFNKPYQLISAGPFKRNEIIKYQKKFTDKIDFLDEAERKSTGLFITDCSEIKRLGDLDFDFKDIDTFIIDHHKTSDLPPNAKGYINANAPAAAYLIQLFYESIIGPVPKALAEILFFGICTDTGFFRFLNSSQTTSDVFLAVSRLTADGADPRKIYNEINNGKPWSTRKLLGVLLNRAERYLNGKLIITYETLEDTHKLGSEGRDSDALYQLLLSSKETKAAVFIRQDSPTTCTGGFRSLDDIDVSVVASKFGGGGHKNASGMSTEGRIDTLIPAIVKEFARIM
ncbi:MAG: bifunctional oligoribonuclease/PAP phosphatase NrnA [Treponema sp.]|nr:bifunctional oligoribonuclease/PAP phosphatase NrnA [Treponema sp.]